MDTLKKYLPFIVIGIVALYALKRFGGGSSPSIRSVIPLTPSSNTNYTDPNSAARAVGFGQLAEIAKEKLRDDTSRQIEQSRFDLAREELAARKTLGLGQQSVQQLLGLADIESQKNIASLREETLKFLNQLNLERETRQLSAYEQELRLAYAQREQDRQGQQAAISRLFDFQEDQLEAQRGPSIWERVLGSVPGIIQTILNPIYPRTTPGTPPTFPTNFSAAYGVPFPEYSNSLMPLMNRW